MCVHPQTWASLTDDWTALASRAAPPAGVFLYPQFQSVWWDLFAQDATLDLCSVRAADGTLIGVLPLMRRGNAVSFIGDPEVCDYMDLLAAPGREDEVAQALLEHLERDDCRAVDLRGLAEGSPTLASLPAAARARGWAVRAEQEAVCPTVALPATWEAYLDGLGGKQRHEVRRKLRNLAEGGARVSLTVERDPDPVVAGVSHLLAMMRDSRRDKAGFLTEPRQAFFLALGRNLASRGWARLYLLQLDGKTVAAILGFDTGDTLFLYNSGYDPDYRDLAVGLASKVYCLRSCIEERKRAVNFLRGEEAYKYQLGGVPSPVTRLLLTR